MLKWYLTFIFGLLPSNQFNSSCTKTESNAEWIPATRNSSKMLSTVANEKWLTLICTLHHMWSQETHRLAVTFSYIEFLAFVSTKFINRIHHVLKCINTTSFRAELGV